MNTHLLLAYVVVAFFYITSPGPAIILAVINGLRADMKVVLLSSLANIIGLFILSTLSILGLGAILKTSATLFMIVKLIGAGYLIYMGIKFFKNHDILSIDEKRVKKDTKKSYRAYFLEAFFLAVTNPKPILFFTAIFPQFLDTHLKILPQFLIMTSIFLFISFLSLSTYGYLFKKMKRYLANERRMAILHKLTGGLFIGLGVGLLKLKN